jgi:hypothetical protein
MVRISRSLTDVNLQCKDDLNFVGVEFGIQARSVQRTNKTFARTFYAPALTCRERARLNTRRKIWICPGLILFAALKSGISLGVMDKMCKHFSLYDSVVCHDMRFLEP